MNREFCVDKKKDKHHFSCPYLKSDMINSYIRIDRFSVVIVVVDELPEVYVQFSMCDSVWLSTSDLAPWKRILCIDQHLG